MVQDLQEVDDLATFIAHRMGLHIHMFLAAGGVVDVEDPLRFAVVQARLQRAVLAGLVARDVETMGDLVTVALPNGLALAVSVAVGPVGRNDAVVAV